MATTNKQSAKSDQIQIRAHPDQSELIDRAASLRGMSRSQFMLSTSLEEAENTLLDERFFVLNAEQWAAFNRVLDTPADNTAAKSVLNHKSPWELAFST